MSERKIIGLSQLFADIHGTEQASIFKQNLQE